MTDTKTSQAADVASTLAQAQKLLNDVTSGRWVTGRLKAGGPITPPMAEAAKPIHQLEQLEPSQRDWLVPLVQPLQAAVDRMAVNAPWAQTYVETWQRASDKIDEIGQLLHQYSATDTQQWQGAAAGGYRDRATEIATALDALATVDKAKTAAADDLAEVASDAYRQASQLLASLVQQLIFNLNRARITQGGVSAQDVADATRLVADYAARIKEIEDELTESVNNLIDGPYLSGQVTPVVTDDQAVGALGIWGQIYKAIAEALSGKTDNELTEPIIPAMAGSAGIRAAAKKTKPTDPDKRIPGNPNPTKKEAFEAWEKKQNDWKNRLDKKQKLDLERGKDYRQEAVEIHGPPPADGREYDAHHPFTVDSHDNFARLGIDTSDPKYSAWVDKDTHSGMNAEYQRDWDSFFQNNPSATKNDAFNFAHELADHYGYTLPDTIPNLRNPTPR